MSGAAPAPAAAAVRVEGLALAYGAVQAVRGVGFSVGRGEHVTLLGPSGCGKTTVLRAIAGLETPGAGRITIGGELVFDAETGRSLPPERRGLSMVFQSYAIWPHMTVFDNVAFAFRARGIAGPRMQKAVADSLALVGLADVAERSATRLSGGQQQRVALARAIAFEPKVVLFDEPLSNLDAQLRLSMRAELKELERRLGFAAIYVTHDQEEALALSDRVIVMREGTIEQEGAPAEVHRAPRTRFVAEFLGVRNLFRCEIVARDGAPTTALLPGGVAITTRAAARAPQAAAWLGFRPAGVRLSTRREELAGESHAGVVARILYLGDLAHYVIKTGELEICAACAPRPELSEGASVAWSIEPEHCFLLED